MSLSLSVDPGGEQFVTFAKKKLKQWHAEMLRTGQQALARTMLVDTGDTIYFNSLHLGNGVFRDRIRIVVTGGFILTDGGVLYAVQLDPVTGLYTSLHPIAAPAPLPAGFNYWAATEDANGVSALIAVRTDGQYYFYPKLSAAPSGPFLKQDAFAVPATGQFFTTDGTLHSISAIPDSATQYPMFDLTAFNTRADASIAAAASGTSSQTTAITQTVVSKGRAGAAASVIVRRDTIAAYATRLQGGVFVHGAIVSITYAERYAAVQLVPATSAIGTGFTLNETVPAAQQRFIVGTGGDSFGVISAPDAVDYSKSITGDPLFIGTQIPYNLFSGPSGSVAQYSNVPGMASNISFSAAGQVVQLLNDVTAGVPVPYSFWPYVKSIRVRDKIYWFVNATSVKYTITFGAGYQPSGNFSLTYSRWVIDSDGGSFLAVNIRTAAANSGYPDFLYSSSTWSDVTPAQIFVPVAGTSIGGVDYFLGLLVTQTFSVPLDGSSLGIGASFNAALCRADLSDMHIFGAMSSVANDAALYSAESKKLYFASYKGTEFLVYDGYGVPLGNLSATPVFIGTDLGREPQAL